VIKEDVLKQLPYVLAGTDFSKLGKKYSGKVRDVYEAGDKLYLVASDRLSAFDRVLALVPFKGQVLSQVSAWWFRQTENLVPNHLISTPDPNVVVAKKLKMFPLEVIVRSYLTGVTSTAIWTAYSKGERIFCGHALPDGLKKNQKLPKPLLTPSTKNDQHDESISPTEVVNRNLVPQKIWDDIAEKALKLFKAGQEIALTHGLILVDTKYEFGVDESGNVCVGDEIHTPDSSRFWIAKTYEERMANGLEPENIDKEFVRLWFKENSDPYADEKLPKAPGELIVELSMRYIQLYEMITGESFVCEIGDSLERIKKNLLLF
jgi:phosphoribosylaminoimidazole-succinocarboxamide synthase